jgi:hypothetical protein
MRYDLVLLSCEGAPTVGVGANQAAYLAQYVSSGGRVFMEHYGYAFLTSYAAPDAGGTAPYPQFPNVANWFAVGGLSNDAPYTADIGGTVMTSLPSGAAFPQGQELAQWLTKVGVLLPNGEVDIPVAVARANARVGGTNVAIPWMQTDPSVNPPSTQLFTFDMPFSPAFDDAGAPEYCGRVAYTDMHVTGSVSDYSTSQAVPAGCNHAAGLSPDEDIIEYMIFGLSGCIPHPDYAPPPSP